MEGIKEKGMQPGPAEPATFTTASANGG